MRAVVQRVSHARVDVDGETVGQIGRGLVILLGVAQGDDEAAAKALARKISSLRIFPNEAGKMDLSLNDIKGEALVVSQFTLYGDCSKGRRPNFSRAARPEDAEQLYHLFCAELEGAGVRRVATGVFGAMMQVSLCNDGPVTLIVESPSEHSN
ncbi:MAG: D-tyrosyl-tRNA(Tyr) deacylase [Firmicutes bacterium]|nr:D-tyrosyl-tRNA(Tyr) deacylase [Bacillota bacterium]